MTAGDLEPGDAVGFREPALASGYELPEGAVGRIVEIMAPAGEVARAVVAFADGRVVAGISVDDLVAEG